jgi:RNA polymerase sigma-70 factor (ECF subfamily)
VTDGATADQAGEVAPSAPLPASSPPACAHARSAPNAKSVFEHWFETEFDYVWHALRRLGVRDADLEDLVHETFLRVHAQQATYDPARPLRPWLFAFAVRVASEFRRLSRNRFEVPGLPDAPPDPAPSAEELVSRSQERDLVTAALESVDFERRAVFVAVEIHEHSGPEVAEALGIPLNTVYSRLRLARDEFTAAIRRQQARSRGRGKR